MKNRMILFLYLSAILWVVVEVGIFILGIVNLVISSTGLLPPFTINHVFYTISPILVAVALLVTLLRLRTEKTSKFEEVLYWVAVVIQVPAAVISTYYTFLYAADAGLFEPLSLTGMLSNMNYLHLAINLFALLIKYVLLLFTIYMLVTLHAKRGETEPPATTALHKEVTESSFVNEEILETPAKRNIFQMVTGILFLFANIGYFAFTIARFYIIETSPNSINNDPVINLIYLILTTGFLFLVRGIICLPLAGLMFRRKRPF
jgi:hypothetical protein